MDDIKKIAIFILINIAAITFYLAGKIKKNSERNGGTNHEKE